MRRYHDEEWGVPSHDDVHLFEMLILEGAQAGLSWSTILNKRENYRRALDGFDPDRVPATTKEGPALLDDPGIVRNRLKVRGTVTNAQAFLEWSRSTALRRLSVGVGRRPADRQPTPHHRRPAGPDRALGPAGQGPEAAGIHLRRIDHRLFVPPAVGLVDDHLVHCPFKAGRQKPAVKGSTARGRPATMGFEATDPAPISTATRCGQRVRAWWPGPIGTPVGDGGLDQGV